MHHRSSHDGFSLVEVLVAGTIAAVAIMSLAQLFAAATLATVRAGETTHGVILAVQKMEELRAVPPEQLASGSDRVGPYVRTWIVAPLPAGAVDASAREVVVRHAARAGVPLARLTTIRTSIAR